MFKLKRLKIRTITIQCINLIKIKELIGYNVNQNSKAITYNKLVRIN